MNSLDAIDGLIDALIDLPATERRKAVDRMRATAPTEAAAVLAWFEQLSKSDGYLEAPPSESSFRAHSGSIIGAWRLRRVIGRGGMGEVWLAERADRAFAKQVAIKFLRVNDDEPLRTGLENERRLLAQLDHPNIARLIDGGFTPAGGPYLVTEYIEGQPIHLWCRVHQATPNERLRLFREVCHAVAFAHLNLIVHRDIKPGNILIDNMGGVHLLDFGIARSLRDDGDYTRQSTTHGFTPDYAAPEQLTGAPITTRTDVYALGILLYLLLSETLPLNTRDLPPAAMLKRICEEQPEPPSRVSETPIAHDGMAATDLDAITLKALAKAPHERYPSVDALLADLDNAQQHRPLLARRANRGYSARCYIRRHRLGIGIAAAFMLVIVAGLIGTLWQAHIAIQERNAAQVERDRARARNDHANAVVDFLVALLGKRTSRGDSTGYTDLLDQASQQVLAKAMQPEQRGVIVYALTLVYDQNGDDVAKEHLLAAFLNEHGTALPDEQFTPLACSLGLALRNLGNLGEARRWLEAGIARATGKNHDGADPSCLGQLAFVIMEVEHDATRSLAMHREALGRVIAEAERSNIWDNAVFMQSEYALALYRAGEPAESARQLREAITRIEHLGDGHGVQIADALGQLGELDAWAGLPRAASAKSTQAIDRYIEAGVTGIAGEYIRAASYQTDLAHPHEALDLLDKAEAELRNMAPGSRHWITLAMQRARSYGLLDRSSDAARELAEASAKLAASSWPNLLSQDLAVIEAEIALGSMPTTARAQAALPMLRAASDDLHRLGTLGYRLLPRLTLDIAEAAFATGDLKAAKLNAEAAQAMFAAQMVTVESAYLARCEFVLGQIAMQAGDPSTGQQLLARAATHLEASLGGQHPRTQRAYALATAR